MAVQEGGLRLTVEQYEQFMSQVGSASGAMQQFGQQAQQTASQITTGFTGAGATFGQLHQQLSQLKPEQIAAITDRANQLIAATSGAITYTEALGQAFQEAGVSAGVAGAAVGAAGQQTDGAGQAARTAEASFIAFGAALSIVSAKATQLILDTTLVAGRIKELEILLEITRQNAVALAEAQGGPRGLAQAAALSSEAVQEQVQGIRDLHLSGIVANETVAQLIRYNLDWTKATELAREAQDAATFAAQDSSQALEGVIKGIVTLQPRILRTYGIMVNLTEAYRDFAKANDLNDRTLTQAQRQQAALNAVLAQAPRIAGAWEASLGSATKQIRSLRTDSINLAEAYGESLEPALAGGVAGLRKFMQSLTAFHPTVRALISGLGAGATSTIALTAAATTAISVISRLRAAIDGLSGTAAIAGNLLLGWGGVLTLGLSATLAIVEGIKAHERTQNNLKTTILASSESYEDYRVKMEQAGVAQDTLTEAIWDTVHAKEADLAVDEARQYIEARNAVEEMVLAFGRLAPAQDTLLFISDGLVKIAENDKLAEIFAKDAEYLEKLLTSGKTFAGTAVEDARKVVDAWRLVAEALQPGATIEQQQEAIAILDDLILRLEDTGEQGVELALILRGVRNALAAVTDATRKAVEEFKRGDLSSIAGAWNEIKWAIEGATRAKQQAAEFAATIAEAEKKAAWSSLEAWLDRNEALEDLDRDYGRKRIELLDEYNEAVAEAGADWVAFQQGTLDELLDLDREYGRKRLDAWTDYQQSLTDIQRDTLRDIEDANRAHLQRLADADADYARDRADALQDYNQDLEDDRREHTQNLLEIDIDYHQAQLDLQKEYEQKLYDIQNLAQQRLRDLQDKYAEEASDTRLKYLRRALESIEGGFYAESFQQTLRELFLGLREFGPGELPYEFEEMYRKLLEDLRLLDEDRKWDEEDLSDDIDREQERRLEDLEEWLAEEQAALDKAHEERIAKEKERFGREQEERRRDYERKLEDLRIAHEREKAEIDRDHQQKLADIRMQSEREREAAAINYQRKLEDLGIQYDREKALIRDKLDDQLQVARDKYNEGLKDLVKWYDDQKTAISDKYNEQTREITRQLEMQRLEAQIEFGKMPAAFEPVWDALILQAQTKGAAWRSAFLGQIQGLFTDIEAHSPSRLMMRLAESMMAGLEKGGFNQDAVSKLMGDAFNAEAFQANIQAALPPGRAMVPGGMGSSTRNFNSTSNLTVNAEYRHQSEASLRNDLALYNDMMRAWGR